MRGLEKMTFDRTARETTPTANEMIEWKTMRLEISYAALLLSTDISLPNRIVRERTNALRHNNDECPTSGREKSLITSVYKMRKLLLRIIIITERDDDIRNGDVVFIHFSRHQWKPFSIAFKFIFPFYLNRKKRTKKWIVEELIVSLRGKRRCDSAKHSRISLSHSTNSNTFIRANGQKGSSSETRIDGEHGAISDRSFRNVGRKSVMFENMIDNLLSTDAGFFFIQLTDRLAHHVAESMSNQMVNRHLVLVRTSVELRHELHDASFSTIFHQCTRLFRVFRFRFSRTRCWCGFFALRTRNTTSHVRFTGRFRCWTNRRCGRLDERTRR